MGIFIEFDIGSTLTFSKHFNMLVFLNNSGVT